MISCLSLLVSSDPITLIMGTAPSIVTIYEKEIPKEILLNIFSHLNCLELGRCAGVNKKEWRPLANDNKLLKNAIYQEKLFTPEYLGLNPEIYEKEAFESLPSHIVQIYKKIGNQNYFIWQPKEMDYKGCQEHFIQNLPANCSKLKPLEKSWVLIPKDAVWLHGFESDEQMRNDIEKNYGKDGWEIPTLFEALFSINAIVCKTGIVPFEGKSIICKDDDQKKLIKPLRDSVDIITYEDATFYERFRLIGIKRLA